MARKEATQILLSLKPQQVRPFSMDGATEADLVQLGLQFPLRPVRDLERAYSMDAAGPQTINAASAGVPVQFLQTLLPGTVRVVTGARKIDDIVGRSIAGKWEDEEIVQTVVELTGQARPYGDYAPGPQANYKTDFASRTVVRFEMDLDVPVLEEARAVRIQQNVGELKRAAAAEALAIEHNAIGFYGYNDGECKTYGFLNDPGLPNYSNLPNGDSGSSKFQDKTFAEIVADLLLAASTLRIQSKEVVQPDKTRCVLAVAASAIDFLDVPNEQGSKTVREWIKDNYGNWRIESALELDGANGGANVFYLYAEELAGPGEDGLQKVIDQYVPATLRLIGVERQAKAIYEVYSSATAGVMVKNPLAVVRYSGV